MSSVSARFTSATAFRNRSSLALWILELLLDMCMTEIWVLIPLVIVVQSGPTSHPYFFGQLINLTTDRSRHPVSVIRKFTDSGIASPGPLIEE